METLVRLLTTLWAPLTKLLWRSIAPYSRYAWYQDISGSSDYTVTVTPTPYFYEVYGVAGSDVYGPSNRVGIFSFAIEPGS